MSKKYDSYCALGAFIDISEEIFAENVRFQYSMICKNESNNNKMIETCRALKSELVFTRFNDATKSEKTVTETKHVAALLRSL